MKRELAAVAVVVVFANGLLAQQQGVVLQVGDRVAIQMTDDLAVEYAKRTGLTGRHPAPSGLEIETSALIAQHLSDGRVRIEHTSRLIRDKGTTRLVTLEATVDRTMITMHVTPKGTPAHASPGGVQTKPTTEDVRTLRLKLSDLKDVKLRAWMLSEELGE